MPRTLNFIISIVTSLLLFRIIFVAEPALTTKLCFLWMRLFGVMPNEDIISIASYGILALPATIIFAIFERIYRFFEGYATAKYSSAIARINNKLSRFLRTYDINSGNQKAAAQSVAAVIEDGFTEATGKYLKGSQFSVSVFVPKSIQASGQEETVLAREIVSKSDNQMDPEGEQSFQKGKGFVGRAWSNGTAISGDRNSLAYKDQTQDPQMSQSFFAVPFGSIDERKGFVLSIASDNSKDFIEVDKYCQVLQYELRLACNIIDQILAKGGYYGG